MKIVEQISPLDKWYQLCFYTYYRIQARKLNIRTTTIKHADIQTLIQGVPKKAHQYFLKKQRIQTINKCVAPYLLFLARATVGTSLYVLLLQSVICASWHTSNHQRSLTEQCHTQNFYLRCFKSDFDAVKSKFDLLIE